MLKNLLFNNHTQEGVSLVEIIVALFILSIISVGLFGLIGFGFQTVSYTERVIAATSLAEEYMEAVRAFRSSTVWEEDGLGTLATDTDLHFILTGDPLVWQIQSGEEQVGEFSRMISFQQVQRDGNDNIVESGGTVDPDSLWAVVLVSWQGPGGEEEEITLTALFTNWEIEE